MKWRKGWRMSRAHRYSHSRAHSPTFPSLHLRHNSFSNPSVASPTSQLILQPFFCFSYITSSSLNSPGKRPMVLMEGIHNNKLIFQKIDVYGFHIYEGEPWKFFFSMYLTPHTLNRSLLVTRQISRQYLTSFQIAWSMFGVTIAKASLMRFCRC